VPACSSEPALLKRIPRRLRCSKVLRDLGLGGMALRTVDMTQPAGSLLGRLIPGRPNPVAQIMDPDHIQHTPRPVYADLSYAQGPRDLILWPRKYTAVPVLQSQAQGLSTPWLPTLPNRETTPDYRQYPWTTTRPVNCVSTCIMVAGSADIKYLKN